MNSVPEIPKEVTTTDIHGKQHRVASSELQWRPSAYAILLQDDSWLALPQFGGYDLPGGGVELGETPEAAVVREVFEETGLHIDAVRLVDVANSFFKMDDEQYDTVQSIMLYYTARVTGGSLSQQHMEPWEVEHMGQAEWLPLSRLDDVTVSSSVDWRAFVRAAAGL